MGLLFAAIGATVTALVEATIGRHLSIGDATPHPVLIGGVIWTIAAGIDRGITWAFVGGTVLDALLGRPLGATAFVLLLVIGAATLIGRPVPRLRLLASVVAVPILSFAYSVLLFAVMAAADPQISVADPGRMFIPGAIYDAIIGMFLGPIAVTLHERTMAAERVDW